MPSKPPSSRPRPARRSGRRRPPARVRRAARTNRPWRRWLVAAGAVLLIAGAVGAAAIITRDDAAELSTSTTEPVPAVSRFALPGRPSALAVADGRVWVADDGDDVVHVIDEATGRDTGAPVRVAADPVAMAAGPDGVFVAHAGGVLTRIDPATRVASELMTDGGSFVGVANGAGAVWVADLERAALLKVDPSSGVVVSTTAIPASPVRIAVVGTTVWVSNFGRLVTPVDAATALAGAPVTVGSGPIGMTVLDDTVWIANSDDDSVSRIDSATRRVVGEPVDVGNAPVELVSAGDSVWVISQEDRSLTRISAESARRVGRAVAIDTLPRGAAAGSAAIWIAGVEPSMLARVQLPADAVK